MRKVSHVHRVSTELTSQAKLFNGAFDGKQNSSSRKQSTAVTITTNLKQFERGGDGKEEKRKKTTGASTTIFKMILKFVPIYVQGPFKIIVKYTQRVFELWQYHISSIAYIPFSSIFYLHKRFTNERQ